MVEFVGMKENKKIVGEDSPSELSKQDLYVNDVND